VSVTRPKRVGVVDMTQSTAHSVEGCESKLFERMSCPVYYVYGRVEDQMVKMMIDSGSGVSLMSEECMNNFVPKPRLLPVDVCLTGLGEAQLSHLGLWDVMVKLGRNRVRIPFVVVKDLSCDAILGAYVNDI